MSDHEEIEEELVACLSEVLLSNDGPHGKDDEHEVDPDLVRYISGMLAAKVDNEGIQHPVAAAGGGGGEGEEEALAAAAASACRDSIDEVLVPFLESMQCSEATIQEAERAALGVLQSHLIERSRGGHNHHPHHPSPSGAPGSSRAAPGAPTGAATRKLAQGVVSLSSDLSGGMSEQEAEANRYLWTGSESAVKAAANTLIDAHSDKSSAKDKRRTRKAEAETARKLLAAASAGAGDVDQDGSGGLVRMNYRAGAASLNQGTDKRRDVLVRNVTVSLDNGTTLLESGELKFAYQRRYGLIGENGVGKSTLLKAIANQSIEGFPANLRVLHVRQEVPSHVSQDVTVTQAVLDSDVERLELLRTEKELVKKLEQAGGDGDGGSVVGLSLQERRNKLSQASESGGDGLQAMRTDLKKLDDVLARLQALRSDSAEGRAAMILTGLQFTPEMQRAKLSSLSGGWKMRVALAAALFIEPEICLLDEPTNHLDLEAVLWLESYLVTYKHTLVVVSHDRGFLNEVCTDVIEFKNKRLTYYRGNFDTYVKLRDANIQNAMRTYHAYQEKREHMMEFITKFRANAKRATMVQSRIKAVEKMDAEAPEPIVVDPTWRFSIPNSEPLGPPIIAVNDVYFDYKPALENGSKKPDDQLLLQCVNFGVDLTSRLAVLGPNGQGKTTLLNLIMGRLKPTKGSVSIHGNLRIGHFTQHSADNFNLKLSAVENLLNMFEEAEDQEIRTFLGKFQIQGNDALKPMQLLSGGQKSRVAFAALAYKKPHVLVIDEGSNHLSMEAVDALVEAVQDFKGGIMVVSHDEYFVSRTCSELWVVNAGKVARFRGDFNDYKKHTSEETHKRVEESLKRLNAAS